MVGLSGMGCEHSHSRETLTGHGRLDSGARLQRKAARTALSVAAAPSFRRCYGSEFTSNAILAWADQNRVEWHYIAPGKPMQTDVVE
ncbi:hypothetical protein [Mesorhizobium sp.]|uniref:hypothetical protein n=1 Tax=Mesorhizobium sp. TaxID=1871066 RepID=UPI000FE89A21|nr:hypothetical protein [Mesorhizobium sp.]RWQ47486.1 MAG: hypothetical protein EOS84_28380 [Mesorhizobium sp.]